MAFERITIVGNIGSVVPMETTEKKKPYIKMSVAVDRKALGASTRVTVWYTVLLFGPLAANPDQFLDQYRKGRMVLVEGRPQTEPYLKNDGTVALDNTIIAITRPELLDSPNRNAP